MVGILRSLLPNADLKVEGWESECSDFELYVFELACNLLARLLLISGFKCLYLTHHLHPVIPQPSMFKWCLRVSKLNYEESLFHSSKMSAAFMVHQPSVISINVSCVGNSSVLERYFPIPRHLTFSLRTQDPRVVFIWNNWGAPRTLNTFKTY